MIHPSSIDHLPCPLFLPLPLPHHNHHHREICPPPPAPPSLATTPSTSHPSLDAVSRTAVSAVSFFLARGHPSLVAGREDGAWRVRPSLSLRDLTDSLALSPFPWSLLPYHDFCVLSSPDVSSPQSVASLALSSLESSPSSLVAPTRARSLLSPSISTSVPRLARLKALRARHSPSRATISSKVFPSGFPSDALSWSRLFRSLTSEFLFLLIQRCYTGSPPFE